MGLSEGSCSTWQASILCELWVDNEPDIIQSPAMIQQAHKAIPHPADTGHLDPII